MPARMLVVNPPACSTNTAQANVAKQSHFSHASGFSEAGSGEVKLADVCMAPSDLRTPKVQIRFEDIPGLWGGATGHLAKGADFADQVRQPIPAIRGEVLRDADLGQEVGVGRGDVLGGAPIE